MSSPLVSLKVKTGTYRHYKGGIYEVLYIGLDSETLRQCVVYKSKETGTVWVRDEEIFMESVIIEGKSVPRFDFLG